MKRNQTLTAPALLFGLGVSVAGLSACAQQQPQAEAGAGAQAAQAASIVEALGQRDQFSRLAQATEQAGLREALGGEGPFTVFAPTNDAFDQLPQGALDQLDEQQLQTLLQHHVIAGERIASDAIPERLEPMAGGPIAVSLTDGEIVLQSAEQQGQAQQRAGQAGGGRAAVVEGDIAAGNGVIHAIDAVLVPQEVRQTLQQQGQQQQQQGQQ